MMARMDLHPRTFPFGVPVQEVTQKPDGLEKRAFVVGIYSSAVHARWIGPDGKAKVAAFAVANEPYIFWRGENAADHIPIIDKQFGRLEPTSPGNNGPSGRALDSHYLRPLGLNRNQVWLSDLVPHTLSNKGQQQAIDCHYRPLQQRFAIPESKIPLAPVTTAAWMALVDVNQLVDELRQSNADTIITLGNVPIKHFINRVSKTRFPDLSLTDYGLPKQTMIKGRTYRVICLAHMRVTKIRPKPDWRQTHANWILGGPGF
jgi:hypothetical protein